MSQPRSQTSSSSSRTGSSRATYPKSELRPPLCHCAMEPMLHLSKTKDNPGRFFWRCPKPIGSQCPYYFFADEQPSSCCRFGFQQVFSRLFHYRHELQKVEERALEYREEIWKAQKKAQEYEDQLTLVEETLVECREELEQAKSGARKTKKLVILLVVVLLLSWAIFLN